MLKNVRAKLKKIFSIRDNQLLRHQWVKDELAKISPGKMILDAGCGRQIYRQYCAHLKYKGQDFGLYDGKGNGEGLHNEKWQYGELDYIGDIWDIQEADCEFDVILCTEVLEHVPYPDKTLREFARLLKPGGVLLLTVPFCCVPHMQPYFYFSGFSREFFERLLTDEGFDELRIDHNGNAFEFVCQEAVRLKQFVANPVLRFLYELVTYGFMVPIFKLLSRFDRISYKTLVFGYHIEAKKKLT